MGDVVIEHGGERLTLLPERAVWWERERCLLAADLHLGRELGMRRLGMPVPEGASISTLRRLADLGKRLGAQRLAILGDLFHSREGRHARWEHDARRLLQEAFADRLLVRGNHDVQAGDPAGLWEFETLEEGTSLGGLCLFHSPPTSSSVPALAGHIHPVVRVRAPARFRIRLPAFWLRDGVLVLPSFGEMTGGWALPPRHRGRAWLCAPSRVFAI